MHFGRAIGLVLVAAVMLAGSGCSLAPSHKRWKVTILVDTPSGPRSGSAVVESSSSDGVPGIGGSYSVKGEAIAVDLPRGTLFALVDFNTRYGFWKQADNCDRRTWSAEQKAHGGVSADFPVTPAQQARFDACNVREKQMRAERQVALDKQLPFILPRENWPQLVRFVNPQDASSVRAVDPDHLGAGFGEGTRIRTITIQQTDDRRTHEIVKRLPWLDGPGGGFPPYEPVIAKRDPDPMKQLSRGDFTMD